jgi:DNA-binding MarR family transcriptional regulator
MGDASKPLPVLDRMMLHLGHVDPAGRGYNPVQQTQSGLAEGVGIQRKHVPRAVRKLVERGFVKLVLQHVDGHRQRLRVHVLTPSGIEDVGRLRTEHATNVVDTPHGRELALDVIDDGRLHQVQSGMPHGTKGEPSAEKHLNTVERAARMLGCSEEELIALMDEARHQPAEDTTTLEGAEAVFLACLHTALNDAIITEDEEAILTRLKAELGPFDDGLMSHVVTLLHDMMK